MDLLADALLVIYQVVKTSSSTTCKIVRKPQDQKILMNNQYEDMQDEIERLLARYRSKWQLTALAWLDYDDISQLIRTHIYKKWHLWDQKRPFAPWCARLIYNQIRNQIRNHYGNFAKPCLKCSHYMGGEECSLNKSGNISAECSLYAKWKKKKEKAYNLKLPLSLDPAVSIGETCIKEGIDYEEKTGTLHELIINKITNDKQKEIYKMIYVDHCSDQEVAEKFGFKQDKKNRKTPRYKQLNNLKKKFYEIGKKIIEEEDLI